MTKGGEARWRWYRSHHLGVFNYHDSTAIKYLGRINGFQNSSTGDLVEARRRQTEGWRPDKTERQRGPGPEKWEINYRWLILEQINGTEINCEDKSTTTKVIHHQTWSGRLIDCTETAIFQRWRWPNGKLQLSTRSSRMPLNWSLPFEPILVSSSVIRC